MQSQKSLVAAALAISLGGLASSAFADDVYCPPSLGRVTIDGNVIVVGRCTLDGTTVKGNVKVERGGELNATKAYIDGNIQAEGARFVRVSHSNVKGDIQLDNVSGQESRINRTTVDGNVQLVSNHAPLLVQYSVIDGDLQAFGNTGGVKIRYNTIDGNLQCKSNRPAPAGGGNQVSGNKEDQCARL